MAATFTAAQWKELETQAMIYKYMVASLPVPYQLLLPIIQNSPLRYSSKQDVEPGRCKRTDGKKWRCSRDVAPNQKYCERHMHRGRPRSRKHVEPSNNKCPSNAKVVGSTVLPSTQTQTQTQTQTPFFLHNMHMHMHMQSNKRGCDWSMEGGCESILNNNDIGEDYGRDLKDWACGGEVLNPLAEVLVGVCSSSCSCSSPYPYPYPYPRGDGVSPSLSSPSQRRML